MGRKKGEGPRQDALQFQANDSVAKDQGGQSTVKVVAPCDFWKLDVNVSSRPTTRRNKLPQPTVEIAWTDQTRDAVRCATSTDDKASMGEKVGHGPAGGRCSAKAAGWYLEAEKDVSLVDGDDKKVDLVMLPNVWVAFEVRDHRSKEFVENIRLGVRNTRIGDLSRPTLADKALDFEHADLRPGDTFDLVSLEHDQFVWEVVGGVTSA